MVSKLLIFGLSALLLCISIVRSVQGEGKLATQKRIMNEILNSTKYDLRIRPVENDDDDSPTEVKVNILIRTLSRIDEMKSEYTAQVTLRQKWMDPRLRYTNMAGKVKFLNLFEDVIWTPDMFITNEKSGFINNLIKPNLYYRIFPDGNVLFSVKLTIVLSCPLNLSWFPFDHQICAIRMASYGFTTQDVIFEWDEPSPVQKSSTTIFPHFTLKRIINEYCHSKTGTGEYSCLKVDFHLRRNIRQYMMHIFVPTAMMVITSWITFWLDHQMILTRLFAVLGSLIVLVFRIADFNSTVAHVSYLKSVDIWTGVCLTFVFAALVELAVVDYRWRSELKKKRRAAGTVDTTDEENGAAFDMKPLVHTQDGVTNQTRSHSTEVGRMRNFYYRWVDKLPTGPKRLDIISRFVFPISFALFVVLYWVINILQFSLG